MGKWKKSRGISEKDIQTLHFLWQWKVAPTNVIHQLLSPDEQHKTTYYRLRALMAKNYLTLQAVENRATRFGWCLTKKGFETIRESLPELREVGFRTEALTHDFLVSAVHLGPWLSPAAGIELFSEQQLKRYSLDLFPSWVPRSESHRSDGYWRVTQQGGPAVIALEVERFPKGSSNYEVVASFYEEHTAIALVVWVVPNQGAARSISTALKRFCPKDHDIHHFVSIPDIELNGWQARFFAGHSSGKTVMDLISPGYRTPFEREILPYFNASKTGAISAVSAEMPQTSETNRLASNRITSVEPTYFESNPIKKGLKSCTAN